MEPIYEVYDREIGLKGKAYIALRCCDVEQAGRVLRQELENLSAQGAKEIFVTSSDPALLLREGDYPGYSLRFARDMVRMECGLSSLPEGGGVRLEPLTGARQEEWLALHNESFFDMPNSATYGTEELEERQGPEHVTAFALANGEPVGVCELDLSCRPPEIEGIGLLPRCRGKGLGRALLHAAMAELAARGYERCQMLVASDNRCARTLYERTGFRETGVQSRWFRLLPTPEK